MHSNYLEQLAKPCNECVTQKNCIYHCVVNVILGVKCHLRQKISDISIRLDKVFATSVFCVSYPTCVHTSFVSASINMFNQDFSHLLLQILSATLTQMWFHLLY
jgi:hypothetical protein